MMSMNVWFFKHAFKHCSARNSDTERLKKEENYIWFVQLILDINIYEGHSISNAILTIFFLFEHVIKV